MPSFILSYDLHEAGENMHRAFIEAAFPEFLYVYYDGTYVSRLPRATLWGKFENIDEAGAVLDRIKAKVMSATGRALNMNRCFLAHFGDAGIESDREKPPEKQWTRALPIATCEEHQSNDPFFDY